MPYVSGPVLGYPIIYLGAVICKYASLEPSSILQSSPNPSWAYVLSLFVQQVKNRYCLAMGR